MERGEATWKQVIVAWATDKDMVHLQSDNEEADTKIILHALDAIAERATELSIYSPDTDVLVLAIRCWIERPPCVREVMGSISDFSLSHARVMLINSPFL